MERGFQRGSGKNREAGQSLAKVKECWGVAKELDASIKHSGGLLGGQSRQILFAKYILRILDLPDCLF
ncbi:MAG: hypothetical protein K0U45_00995 [Alphaproteobacteria bacterium]|nr:hypothetical protein [Alphaproteobacteria bacterium]